MLCMLCNEVLHLDVRLIQWIAILALPSVTRQQGPRVKDLSNTHSCQRSSAAIAALSRYGAKLERRLAGDVL